jgi:hypothetical protein
MSIEYETARCENGETIKDALRHIGYQLEES